MANLTRSHTIINFIFKSLSVVTLAVAATRLALQYDHQTRRIQYVTLTFLLIVETAIAIVMASISSYRVVVVDQLAERRMRKAGAPTQSKAHRPWYTALGRRGTDQSQSRWDGSFASLPIVQPARLSHPSSIS
jgi:uncharacterized membrane protein